VVVLIILKEKLKSLKKISNEEIRSRKSKVS
jgi:hypothetical protein